MVTWSLAIEEQYYFVWPLLVRLLRPQILQGILLALIATQPILRFVLIETGTSPLDVYRSTHCRLDGLALGGLVALWTSGATARPGAWLGRLSSIAAYGLLPALWLAYVIVVGQEWPPSTFSGGHARAAGHALLYTLTALAHGGLMLEVLLGRSPRLSRVLEHPWMQLVGKLSYCLYLVHLPVLRVVNFVLRPRVLALLGANLATTVLLIVFDFAVTLALAMISWRFLEKPILALKDRFSTTPLPRPAAQP
jgi:peptidoglycan/LPS O-acetylase OafA/YrhL